MPDDEGSNTKMRARARALGWNADSIISAYLLSRDNRSERTAKWRDEVKLKTKGKGVKIYEK